MKKLVLINNIYVFRFSNNMKKINLDITNVKWVKSFITSSSLSICFAILDLSLHVAIILTANKIMHDL